MTPTTISELFIKWMEDNGYGTFDPLGNSGNIFLNQIPDDAVDNAYWIITAGGDASLNLVTAQNIKPYTIQVNYRNISGKAVERNLFELENQIGARNCLTLDGLEIYSLITTTPEDNDKDVENRRQGLFNITISVYKSYVS